MTLSTSEGHVWTGDKIHLILDNGTKIEIMDNGFSVLLIRADSIILHPVSSNQINLRTKWPNQ